MNQLLAYINTIAPLPETLQIHLGSILCEKVIAKKEYLLKAGEICRNICFIRKGIVRCFYHKDNKEVCSWFMKEEDFIISVESFFKQTESFESIQALEDCLLYCIYYQQLKTLYTMFPEFNLIGRILTEKYYILSEQRLFSLRMQRSYERYKFMIDNHREIIQRVPSKYIASYLGVTEETLSRIRSGKY